MKEHSLVLSTEYWYKILEKRVTLIQSVIKFGHFFEQVLGKLGQIKFFISVSRVGVIISNFGFFMVNSAYSYHPR